MTIFSKILAGEIPSAKVYEDDFIYVFMDAFPQSLGHTLIIPKRAAPDLLSVDAESLQHIILFSQKLARAQKSALAADGIRVVQYNGAAAGQTVFHYHMHLIPMWEGKKLGNHYTGAAPLAELQETAAKIQSALESQA